jgi:hypothetical protein
MTEPIDHLITAHLSHTDAAIVVDGNGEAVIAGLLASGWTWDEQPSVHCSGQRIRYLRAPASEADKT